MSTDTPIEIDSQVTEILERRRERFETRRERRLENAHDRANKNRQLATNYYRQSRTMSRGIPLGQPILVGHYSEGRDRRFRQRMRDKMDKSIEADKTAAYYEQKATAIENNTAVFSDDPDAILKLEAKIKVAREQQEYWKSGNKIVKSKKLTAEQKIEQLKVAGHCPSILAKDFCGRIGYADYLLSNNNANIRRMAQRITELKQALINTVEIGDTQKQYPELNLTVKQARTIDRVQLVFKGKPSQKIRDYLKSTGFRWAPSEGAWQRRLGTGYDDRYLIEKLTEISQS
ncbi:MAG: DUF3560 domain-containing protein [Chamaesiphon sp. CSU_1_12]|nr:DUF3560 domain-containing protein [Chamaesiphon sp. CSU_1_12]